MRIRISLTLSLMVFGSVVFAQESLNLDQSIAKALDHNLNIQLIDQSVQISENSATKGNAGLLPSVSANGSVQYGNNNTNLEIVGQPQPIETTGAESFNYNASVNLGYTLFSGLGNLRKYDKLLLNVSLSEMSSRLQIEGVLMQVVNTYFNVLRAKQNLDLIAETVAISKERYINAETRYQLSGGAKLDVLNATVDLNQDSVNYVNAQRAHAQAELGLNRLLGVDLTTQWELEGQIELGEMEEMSALAQAMESQNSAIQIARYREQASLLDYQIVKSTYLPTLSLSGAYAYARSENEGSFLSVNQSTGLSAGLSLSVPIYAGGTRKTREKNAKVGMELRQLELKDQSTSLRQDLVNAYQSFENARRVVDMETRNVAVSDENFRYSQAQYNNGQLSSLQFRQAQINLLLVQNSLNNAKYNAKLAEVELKRLTGRLVEQ